MKLHRERKSALLLLGILAACTEPSAPPADITSDVGSAPSFQSVPSGVKLAGIGQLSVTAPAPAIGIAKFEFFIKRLGNDPLTGKFHMVRPRAGFIVDFTGEVTCIAVDPVNRRAWIGGVVTANNSNDPNHSLAIHQPGRDVWFRIHDGVGVDADRSSVLGFEGAAGIITSADYCAARLWTDGNVNAFEVTRGDIQILGQ